MYRYNESFVFCSLAAFMQVSYQSTESASGFSKPVLIPLFSLSREIPGKGESWLIKFSAFGYSH
jgi:hypothetical protein